MLATVDGGGDIETLGQMVIITPSRHGLASQPSHRRTVREKIRLEKSSTLRPILCW